MESVFPKLHRATAQSLAITLVSCATLGLYAGTANAGATVKIDETKWLSVGAGLRTSFNMVEDAAPSGDDYSSDFKLDSVRLYLNGQVHQYFKLTYNTERDGSGSNEKLRTLDAIARFEYSELFNVWAGRFLPPSDRANLDGPYYLSTWNFPITSQYPAIFAGRDDGAAVWGQVDGGRFKYQVGAFQGCSGGKNCGVSASSPNEEDSLLWAGRFTYNVWDPEPGYYTSSTYYGAKDILSIGLVLQTQADAAGTTANQGDFFGWNIDVLMEKKVANGVITAEASYNDYDLDDEPSTSLVQGNGYYLLGAFLLPEKIGIGQLQPTVRYQTFDVDNGVDTEIWELGLNYVISGHDARFSFVVGNADTDGGRASTDAASLGSDGNFFQVGLQLQL